jgi:DNA-binding XRE family transcriptional regulator
MNQAALAQNAGLGLSTVVDFERERRQVSDHAARAIMAAFERAGIMFIEENGGGEGVRLKKPKRVPKK